MIEYTNIQGVLINTGHLLIMGKQAFIDNYKANIQDAGAEWDKLKIETIDADNNRPLQSGKTAKRK